MEKLTKTEKWLIDKMEQIPITDAHEHLPSEKIRLSEHFDALTLFRQYTRLPMFSAGLDEPTFMQMHDPEQPLDKRFAIFEKYRDIIRFTGFARAAYITLEKFYGEKELTRDNFDAITDKMKKLYTPGLYTKVLKDACSIHAVLQNSPMQELDFESDLLKPIPSLWQEWGSFNELAKNLIEGTCEYNSPDEYLKAQKPRLLNLIDRGAVAFKHKTHYFCEPDRDGAIEVFNRLKRGDTKAARMDVPNPLCNYITDSLFKIAAELDAVISVHTGIGVPIVVAYTWDDIRQLDCLEMVPYIMRYPNVKFDLFHMGVPFVRSMARIGGCFPNVWLNMCWTHTLSPVMAAQALDEWLDQVAINKIIAFGGDVRWPVEKIYGHLVITKQVVAKVLAGRIEQGLMNKQQAINLAERWFDKNVRELYRL